MQILVRSGPKVKKKIKKEIERVPLVIGVWNGTKEGNLLESLFSSFLGSLFTSHLFFIFSFVLFFKFERQRREGLSPLLLI